MIRFLPLLVEVGLLVYCLIDCARTDPAEVRRLPKGGWIVLIILLPLIGGMAWLMAGRPAQTPESAAPGRSTPTAGPRQRERMSLARPLESDIDARLRAEQDRIDREFEQAVRRWQQESGKGPGDGPKPVRGDGPLPGSSDNPAA